MNKLTTTILASFLLALSLVSCVGQSGKMEHVNNEMNYSISFPSVITDSGSWINEITKTRDYFFGSAVDHTKNPPFGEREIGIEIRGISSCDSFTDTVDITLKNSDTSGVILWGKVDNKLMTPNYPELTVFCKPQIIAYVEEDGSWAGSHAYALCSEKDNKTVLICISQMTDNPTLAEEIFKTFRWTN